METLQTSPWNAALHAAPHAARPSTRLSSDQGGSSTTPKALTAAERVIAAELKARGEACDALSMMVSSVARMVQAGRCSENRWNAG